MIDVTVRNVPGQKDYFQFAPKYKPERTLVMLTSCPRCQHNFRAPCCGEALSPEASPSLPLSFILPDTGTTTVEFPLTSSDLDLQRISLTLKRLKISGWYYEGITWQESINLLSSVSPGTFLVRESSDPRFLFSLSIQGRKGPISVRINYVNGYFRLDAEPSIAHAIPVFDCVIKLVEFYMKNKPIKNDIEHVFLDWNKQNYFNISLKKPLYQRNVFPSLKHLARLQINSYIQNGDIVPNLNIPVTLKGYLQEYPYTH